MIFPALTSNTLTALLTLASLAQVQAKIACQVRDLTPCTSVCSSRFTPGTFKYTCVSGCQVGNVMPANINSLTPCSVPAGDPLKGHFCMAAGDKTNGILQFC